jgi:hypothetical protein
VGPKLFKKFLDGAHLCSFTDRRKTNKKLESQFPAVSSILHSSAAAAAAVNEDEKEYHNKPKRLRRVYAKDAKDVLRGGGGGIC